MHILYDHLHINCRELLRYRTNGDDYDLVAKYNIFLAKRIVCDYSNYEIELSWLLDNVKKREIAFDRLPTHLPFDTLLIDCGNRYRLQVAMLHAVHFFKPAETMLPKKIDRVKLRFGYISYDWGNHPTAHLAVSLFKYQQNSYVESHVFNIGKEIGEICLETGIIIINVTLV